MQQQTSPRPSRLDRFGALSGAAYVVLILVGNSIATAGAVHTAHPTGAQALRELGRQAHSGAVGVGNALEMLGFVAFAVFLSWLVGCLRSAGGQGAAGQGAWLATVALIGGVTTLAVKIASFMPMAAAGADRTQIDPTLARVLADQNGAGFVITFMTMGIFVAGAGAAVLATRVAHPAFGWTGLALGAAGIVVVTLVQDDFAGANPLPFLLTLVWVLVLSLRLGLRAPRAATTVPVVQAPSAAPTPA